MSEIERGPDFLRLANALADVVNALCEHVREFGQQ